MKFFTIKPDTCVHKWEYDGSGGYLTNRYVCSKCGATKWE